MSTQKVQVLVSFLMFSLLCAACAPSRANSTDSTRVDPTAHACCDTLTPGTTQKPAPSDLAQARSALEAYFDALNAGQYEKAMDIYGGSYEVLLELNPEIDPNDHAALLKSACTMNGFQCLRIKKVIKEAQVYSGTFTFVVEFLNPDGSLFVLSPCCRAAGTDLPPQSQFEFTVQRIPQAGNAYLVQSLPVYMPSKTSTEINQTPAPVLSPTSTPVPSPLPSPVIYEQPGPIYETVFQIPVGEDGIRYRGRAWWIWNLWVLMDWW